MALPVRKGYKGAAASAVLTNSPASGDTSFTVNTVTGWPTTFPFYAVVAPGTSKEEKVKVTAISTLTLTVVRSQDDTTAPATHASGSTIYPVFTADEADEANLIASAMTTKGDIITTDGSSINRLGVGTNTHVLQADSTATNGVKWGQVATAGIADSAVTTAKITDANVTADKLASNAVTTVKITDSNVTTAKIADDAVTLAKLAPAATPGMVHLNTTSVSGESSKTISSILSSTYSSYKVVLSNFTISTSADWTMTAQLTSSGTPGGSYARMFVGTSELSTSVVSYVTGTGGNLEIARGYYDKPTFVEWTIDNPSTGTVGSQMFVNASFRDSINGWQSWSGGAVQKNNFTADGIKIATVGGQLMTGTITVYGYLK